MAGDQGAGRGHTDVDRARHRADAGGCLLAERGVSLVADDHRVGVGNALGVADEPLVGLDRHRSVGLVAPVEQRRAQPVLVSAIGYFSDELVDQVAAVGEDQDTAGAGRFDEADCGHRLAGPGGMLKPEAAGGAGVVGGFADLFVILGFLVRLVFPVERLFILGDRLVDYFLFEFGIIGRTVLPGPVFFPER